MIKIKNKFIVCTLIIILCLFEMEFIEILAQDTMPEEDQSCPAGTLLEPYSGICATINDKKHLVMEDKGSLSSQSIPSLTDLRNKKALMRGLQTDDAPVPGGNGGGISYKSGQLQALEQAELHTKMFVYPYGWNPSFSIDWLFTPATNRMDNPVEVVGIYSKKQGDQGSLGLFGRSCSEDYPCPNGETESGWQWFIDFSDLACNLSEIVDNGGHQQTVIHYANTTVKLDQESPPLWRNAVYLWNYCSKSWDLVYDHDYRENKSDCSIEGCAWWGPILEFFGDEQPEINELGFEDTLLFHDGVWSELPPAEANFKNPILPWILSHLDPNRGFGAGNYFVIDDSEAIAFFDWVNTWHKIKIKKNAVCEKETSNKLYKELAKEPVWIFLETWDGTKFDAYLIAKDNNDEWQATEFELTHILGTAADAVLQSNEFTIIDVTGDEIDVFFVIRLKAILKKGKLKKGLIGNVVGMATFYFDEDACVASLNCTGKLYKTNKVPQIVKDALP